MTYRLPNKYCVCLMHFDGPDGSTTFVDESGKSWTANGNAQIDTAQSVFGGGSLLLDGTEDYLSASDSLDWRLDGGSNSNLWAVSIRMRFASDPTGVFLGLLEQYVDNDNYWAIFKSSANSVGFRIRSGGVNLVDISWSWSPSASTWYDLGLVKNGTSGYMCFVDGSQIGSTTTATTPMPDFAGLFTVGRVITSSTFYMNGWIDELAIFKGLAVWTTNYSSKIRPWMPPTPSVIGSSM